MASTNTVYSPSESDTRNFLKLAISKLNWGDLSDAEVVMDIGCGVGNSTNIIDKMFPEIKLLIGFDCSPTQVQLAISQKSKDKIMYYVANVENRLSLQQWECKMSRIFSIHCLNWVLDQKAAFRNIYYLLKKGGGACVLFTVNSPYYRCLTELRKIDKWKQYIWVMERLFNDSRSAEYKLVKYRKFLEEIGFEVVHLEKENKFFEFPSEKVFSGRIVNNNPLLSFVPIEKKEEFKNDFFKIFRDQNGKTADGRPRIMYHVISILIRKN